MRNTLRWFGSLLAAVLVGVFALAPAATYAAENDAVSSIAVTGQGVVIAQYDTAQITLGVTALEQSPLAAYQSMAKDINNVVEALRAAGIKDEDMKTGTFSLYAEYDWTDQGQKLRGFRATNTLVVTTSQLDKVADLVQTVVNAGANQLQGIDFLVKDTDKVMGEALDLAIDDARAKAERAAARLGATLGKPLSVTVSDGGRSYMTWNKMADMAALGAAQAPAPVFSGTEDFTVMVNVTWELK